MKQLDSEFFIKNGAWVYAQKHWDKKGKLLFEGTSFLSVKTPQKRYATTLSWEKWEKLSLIEKIKWIKKIVEKKGW